MVVTSAAQVNATPLKRQLKKCVENGNQSGGGARGGVFEQSLENVIPGDRAVARTVCVPSYDVRWKSARLLDGGSSSPTERATEVGQDWQGPPNRCFAASVGKVGFTRRRCPRPWLSQIQTPVCRVRSEERRVGKECRL